MSVTTGQPDEIRESGWEEHRRAQLQRWARLPFWQKLEWLEEAQQLAEHLQSARRKGAQSGGPLLGCAAAPEVSEPKTS